MAAVLAMVLFYRPVKWWEADRSSAGLAPLPQEEKAAVVQVYAARTINWKGWLSVHSWIATKEKDADYYETYQVMGYRVFGAERRFPSRKTFLTADGSAPSRN